MAAKHQVWLANARLAYTVVNKSHVAPQHVPDAIQAAQIGLNRAIYRFEPGRLNEFSTYAYHWLRQAILRHKMQMRFSIRIPSHLYKDYCRFHHIRSAPNLSGEHEDVYLEWLRNNPARLRTLARLHALAASVPLSNEIPSDDFSTSSILAEELADRVEAALCKLSPREQYIIVRRYGLRGMPEQTLQEIGEALHLTRERIRQVQRRAETKLRRDLRHYAGETA